MTLTSFLRALSCHFGYSGVEEGLGVVNIYSLYFIHTRLILYDIILLMHWVLLFFHPVE